MTNRKPSPGISRSSRISNEGLQRLDKQLKSGIRISNQVLCQWIKRYGEPARELIKEHGFYCAELESLISECKPEI